MSVYPTIIDSFTVHANGDVILPDYDNAQQVALLAIEAKLGIDGSAVNTSFDFKLSGVATGDKAVSKTGTETLTNKTLTAPIMTSPAITFGSDADGDIMVRQSGAYGRFAKGSALQVLRVNAGATALEYATPAAIINASTTVSGVVEIATAAEITAGTATGGTGAILAMSPDQLALATPVFNGSGLTLLTMKSTSGTSAGPSSSTTQTITHSLGKTPTIIRIIGMGTLIGSPSSASASLSHGTWNASGNICVYADAGLSAGSVTPVRTSSFAVRFYEDAATDGISSGVIQNVTSTTFDIVWTVTQGTTGNSSFIWEAE